MCESLGSIPRKTAATNQLTFHTLTTFTPLTPCFNKYSVDVYNNLHIRASKSSFHKEQALQEVSLQHGFQGKLTFLLYVLASYLAAKCLILQT